MIVFSVSALIVAGLYMFHQKRILNTNFNINVSFRNNDVRSEFPNNLNKSPPHTHFTHHLPKMMGLHPKGFEVINDDHNENHFVKSDQMQNFSDEESLADVEFTSSNDQEKLIN